ncbi:MAG: hypothetical protein RR035_04715 [Oscillibacter sp.]
MKKKRNPLFYLGWLGFVGLVGIFCGASILASFLPFFLGSFVVTLCTFVFALMIFHYREKKLLEQEGLSC